jgi:hypothetical protein
VSVLRGVFVEVPLLPPFLKSVLSFEDNRLSARNQRLGKLKPI